MNTRKFLETVWPQSGYYCIASPWVTPDGRRVYSHRAFDNIDDAMTFILRFKSSKDLYFAPHTLKVARELNPETGKQQTFRTHENMQEACAFFFDIDAGKGENKHYATQAEILSALEQFLFETSLPNPFVVSSGYGVHVYWIIDTPMESVAWREPAARLFWLAEQHGLHVDPMRTTDQSSVLRVPGAFNLKNPKRPRRVEILAEGTVGPEFLIRLNALTSGYAPSAAASLPKGNGAGHGNGMGVAWDGRHPPADEVAGVCEHMRTFRDSQGNVPEPAWHVGIGTIKHCDDGQDKAHEWSSGYPRYTKEETQAKLDAWTTPPPGCEKIDKNSGDPAICARCPLRDLAKNPILIANKVYELRHQRQSAPAPTSANPTPLCQPPAPYILDMDHGVREKKTGVICELPMFPIHWVTATSNESCLSLWMIKPQRGDWEQIEILNDELELKNLAPALRDKDIYINPKQVKHMHGYMLAYIKELQKYQDSLKQYDYVGWETKPVKLTDINMPVELGDPKYFVLYGRRVSVADGSVIPCVMTKNTQLEGMGREGSLAQQIALMEFYNKPGYMAQQFAIAVSLATPFFRFSNQHGMLICLTGDTGSSKSTGAFFASSLWGHPELFGISGTRSNATDKARQERGAVLRNLPFVVDEITLLEPEVMREIVLSATQAGSRERLKATGEFRKTRGGYKSNLTICTSNSSLVQTVATNSPTGQASIMRVFEIKVEQNDARSKTEADDVIAQLNRNYGWIGEDMLRRCLPSFAMIKAKFLEILRQLEADINATQEERFMTAAAATALLGVKLGNKLGYFRFSYKAIREWLINVQIPAMRAIVSIEREHQAPEAILNEYLESINPNICRINKNLRGETEVLYSPPHVECKARFEIAKGIMYARSVPFIEYCTEHHYDYSGIINRLATNGPIIHKSIRRRMRNEQGTFSNPVACFAILIKAASVIAVPSMPDESRKIVELKTPPARP